MALVHYAAVYNKPQIITVLAVNAMDLNVKKVTSTTIHGKKGIKW